MTAVTDTATDADLAAILATPEDDPEDLSIVLGEPEKAHQDVAEKWARWLRGATREAARVDAIADEEVARLKAQIAFVEARRAEMKAPALARIASLTTALEGWVLAYRLRTGKASAKLLYATLRTTARQARRKVTDRSASLTWARVQRPDMVRTVTPDPFDEVDTEALLAYIEETGDLVDGVELIPASTTAKVIVEGVSPRGDS